MRCSIAIFGICLFGSLLCQGRALSWDGVQTSLTSAKLLEDVDILQRVYESAHPGVYRYNTKSQMAEHFATLRAEFARDRALPDSYVIISQFLAKIKCGHTYADFFNQPKDVVQALFAGKNRLPFGFRWIDNRMIVTRDLSPEAKLKAGTEILAIGGIKSADILSRLMTIARADGSNDAKRVVYLEVLGTGKYEAFDIFLPLFFPQIGERIELRAREPSSCESVAIAVAAQDMEQRKARSRTKTRSRSEESRSRSGGLNNSTSARLTFACRAGRSTTANGIGRHSSNADSMIWWRSVSRGSLSICEATKGARTSGIRSLPGLRPKKSGTTDIRDTPATARYHCPSRSMRIWTRGTGRSRTGAKRPRMSETGFSA